MKNKLIILLCLAILAMAALASCGGGETAIGDCEHPVSEEWTTTETHHWHATTCEHGEFRTAYGEHVDVDEDGICDTCAYEVGHVHTYSSDWSRDLAGHWHNATCTHTAEVGDFALHSDDNANGKCDECGAHVHVVNSASGKCSICDVQVMPVDTSDLSDVIAAITGGYSNVTGGKITKTFTGRYGGSSHYTNTAQVTEYLLGKTATYYKIDNSADVKSVNSSGEEYEISTSNLLEKWHGIEEDGSIFGVCRETIDDVVGEFSVDAGANKDTVYGYYYSVSTLASGYGAEGILAALYEKSQEQSASDFVVEHEEGTNTYKFTFNSTLVNTTSTTIGIVTNVNYFEVEVEFSYDENYSLTNLSIICDCYTSDAGSKAVTNEETGETEYVIDDANVDFTYDANTGKITMKPGALADTYTFVVEQTVGERTFVNEYNKAYFAPKGFLVYADEECTTLCPDTVTVSVGEYARFYLQDSEGQKFTTATAEALEWTTSDESGLSCQFAIGNAFSFATSHVKFLAKTAGTYTVTLTYQGVTKTFTVIVTA